MKRRQYTEEFKRDALELVKLNGSLKGTARELGIDDRTLRRWAQQRNKPTSVSGLKQAEKLEKDDLIRRQHKQIRVASAKLVKFLTPPAEKLKYQYIEQHRSGLGFRSDL